MNKAQGFTLVEVMIAAIILFTALAYTAQLYSGASLSAEKALSVAQKEQLATVLVSAVKTDLRIAAKDKTQSNHQGSIMLASETYVWQAQRVSFNARAMELSDAEPPRPQFSLFDVNVYVLDPQGNQTSETPFMTVKVNSW